MHSLAVTFITLGVVGMVGSSLTHGSPVWFIVGPFIILVGGLLFLVKGRR